jgi:DNA polymerase I-like protein with 3'-5' exonuclease and polymerase domains
VPSFAVRVGSDLLKVAMIELSGVLRAGSPVPPPHVAADVSLLRDTHILLQIHDELIVECVDDVRVCQAYVVRLRLRVCLSACTCL